MLSRTPKQLFILVAFGMSDDEDICVLWWWLKNKKKQRKYWIHPLLTDRTHSCYQIAKEFDGHKEKFQSFYRMSKPAFQHLVELVGPHIKKKDTNCRMALREEEKLIITLR